METAEKVAHTPGAMRASIAIDNERPSINPKSREEWNEAIAQIIDRETGCLEMLEALEAVLAYAPHERFPFTERVATAIRKARGL